MLLKTLAINGAGRHPADVGRMLA